MKELKITLEEFKLIKSFYPAFTRKNRSKTNDFIIDWNSLMPVVDHIERLGYGIHKTPFDFFVVEYLSGEEDIIISFEIDSELKLIEGWYCVVSKFIYWRDNVSKT